MTPTSLQQTPSQWTLSSANLTIAIDKATGTIVSLIDPVDGFDACRPGDLGLPSVGGAELSPGLASLPNLAMIGGLRITDELTGQTFCDFSTPSTITPVEVGESPDGSQQVILDKHFEGAQFDIRVTYRLEGECLVWLADLAKRAGAAERSVRIVFIVPQPSRRLWGPMAEPFVDVMPEQPIMIRHGLYHGRAVASQKRSIPVPLLSFIREKRCLALALPVEVPNVLVRFMNNADESHLNVLNSLSYAPSQREYFKVIYDFLGLRDGKATRAGVLLSAQAGQWRAALGWYSRRYARYFMPDERIRAHEGVYHGGRPDEDGQAKVRERMIGRRERGVRWAEMHCHFPWYGLYAPDMPDWIGEHSDIKTTYDLVRQTTRLYQEQGIKVHLYYNIIDGKRHYVDKAFPESIVVNERGQRVPAFVECWLMNADPDTPFGKHMLAQFDKLMTEYADVDAIFFDVYGRHYNIDFGHDDGLTMIHNRPAYCLKFAFLRIMDRIEPKARAMGKQFSANKPEGIETMAGIDLVMADEGHDPYRLEAFSYYGLYKPIMVLDVDIWKDPEPTMKTCLRLAMMYNDMNYDYETREVKLPPEEVARNIRIRDAYTPLLQELVGKHWVLDPDPLTLPAGVNGNIYRVPDGRVIVTMTSDGRSMFEEGHFAHDLSVVVRFEGMEKFKKATVRSADYPEVDTATIKREGDALTITVPRHRTATMVILE